MQLPKFTKNSTFLVSLGAGIEFYDIMIYNLLSLYISTNFFPSSSPTLALIQTFGIIVIGNVARLLTGIYFGVTGDLNGRTKPIVISIFLISLATFGIAILPTYEQIGVIASVLLLLLRVSQSAAYSAEIPGAITVINENLTHNKRGMQTSFISSGAGLTAIFAMLLVSFLSSQLSSQQMLSWGWRIPFYIGGLFAIAGFLLRKNLIEPKDFREVKISKSGVEIFKTLFKDHRAVCIKSIFIIFFIHSTLTFTGSLPAFLSNFMDFPISQVYKAYTIMSLGIFFTPLFGFLSDKIGRKKLLAISCLAYMFSIWGMFQLFFLHTFPALILYFAITMIFNSALIACFLPLIAELFPTEIRYTATCFSYNCGVIFGSLTPVIIMGIMYFTHQIYLANAYLSILALSAFCLSLTLPNRNNS